MSEEKKNSKKPAKKVVKKVAKKPATKKVVKKVVKAPVTKKVTKKPATKKVNVKKTTTKKPVTKKVNEKKVDVMTQEVLKSDWSDYDKKKKQKVEIIKDVATSKPLSVIQPDIKKEVVKELKGVKAEAPKSKRPNLFIRIISLDFIFDWWS